MCDDVFDDGDKGIIPEETEWKRLQDNRMTDGFREGLAKGEELELQTGFNAGYRSSVKIAFDLSKLRGITSAVLGTGYMKPGTYSEEYCQHLEDLLHDIVDTESRLSGMAKPSNIKQEKQRKQEDLRDPEGGCCSGSGKCQVKTKDACANKILSPQEHLNSFSQELQTLWDRHKEILKRRKGDKILGHLDVATSDGTL